MIVLCWLQWRCAKAEWYRYHSRQHDTTNDAANTTAIPSLRRRKLPKGPRQKGKRQEQGASNTSLSNNKQYRACALKVTHSNHTSWHLRVLVIMTSANFSLLWSQWDERMTVSSKIMLIPMFYFCSYVMKRGILQTLQKSQKKYWNDAIVWWRLRHHRIPRLQQISNNLISRPRTFFTLQVNERINARKRTICRKNYTPISIMLF